MEKWAATRSPAVATSKPRGQPFEGPEDVDGGHYIRCPTLCPVFPGAGPVERRREKKKKKKKKKRGGEPYWNILITAASRRGACVLPAEWCWLFRNALGFTHPVLGDSDH